MVDDS
jgi:AraC-like DNA-binding protein